MKALVTRCLLLVLVAVAGCSTTAPENYSNSIDDARGHTSAL